MSPSDFYDLDVSDFSDMVNAKLRYNLKEQDEKLEWGAWFVANLMLSGGNMKKGSKADKISKALYMTIEEREKEAQKRANKKQPQAVEQEREKLLNAFKLSGE